jgi:hypothetical protein
LVEDGCMEQSGIPTTGPGHLITVST